MRIKTDIVFLTLKEDSVYVIFVQQNGQIVPSAIFTLSANIVNFAIFALCVKIGLGTRLQNGVFIKRERMTINVKKRYL